MVDGAGDKTGVPSPVGNFCAAGEVGVSVGVVGPGVGIRGFLRWTIVKDEQRADAYQHKDEQDGNGAGGGERTVLVDAVEPDDGSQADDGGRRGNGGQQGDEYPRGESEEQGALTGGGVGMLDLDKLWV